MKALNWILFVLIVLIIIGLWANIIFLPYSEEYFDRPDFEVNKNEFILKDRIFLIFLSIPIMFSGLLLFLERRQRLLGWRAIQTVLICLLTYIPIIYFKQYLVGYILGMGSLLFLSYMHYKRNILIK